MTRDEETRSRFLRESTGVGSRAPWEMTPGRYDSDDLDRAAAAFDRARYIDDETDARWANDERDLSDMAEWRASSAPVFGTERQKRKDGDHGGE